MNNSIMDPEFAIALLAHVDGKYPLLSTMEEKLGLTQFTLFSPANIHKVDGEVSANPNIINEAISLLEFCDVLSIFYSQSKFSDLVRDRILQARASQSTNSAGPTSPILAMSVMREYFTDRSLENFICNNPSFLGIYIHIFISKMA